MATKKRKRTALGVLKDAARLYLRVLEGDEGDPKAALASLGEIAVLWAQNDSIVKRWRKMHSRQWRKAQAEEGKTPSKLPRVGQKIYVPTQLYIDRGEDDVSGGWAIISCIRKTEDGVIFISVEGIPRVYVWQNLQPLQADLQRNFKSQRACPCPDR